MPNKYKRTKVADDAQARRLLIDIFTKYHQSKDINNRSLGLAIQALDKESNTKGLIGRPDRKSTRLNSSHIEESRMPSSA